jgi:hypothetical protein
MKSPFSKQPPKPKFDLYIIHGKDHSYVAIGLGEYLRSKPPLHHPGHWMLMLTPKDETEKDGTLFQMKRGATGYELSIKEDRSLWVLEAHVKHFEKLASFTEQEDADFRSHAQTIEAKRCQDFVLDMLRYLAVKGVIEKGVVEHYREQSQRSVLTQLRQGPWRVRPSSSIASMLKDCWEYAEGHGLGSLTYDTCLE